MKVLRTEGDYELNEGSTAAKGLFNVTDQAKDETLTGTAKMRVSTWFDEETKNRIVNLSKEEFEQECELLLSS